MKSLSVVVLAAGSSSRMRSSRSKVLHTLAGRPLLHYPVLASAGVGPAQLIVVASPKNRSDVERCLAQLPEGVPWEIAVQSEPRGTGDAARAALAQLRGERVLILCGDTPLVGTPDLVALLDGAVDAGVELALSTCVLADPTGYGRILRDARGEVTAVREERDLDAEQRAIREVNAGIYCVARPLLEAALSELGTDNAQGEYYLTDVVAAAARRGRALAVPGDAQVLQGINDRRQLARLEAALFERIADRHRAAGVSVQLGARIDDAVQIGGDTSVAGGAVLRGATRVGAGVFIDHGVVLDEAVVEDGAVIKPHCVITRSRVGARAQVGPFAHLRPGSELEAEVHVGNFVETKQTVLREGAKANHLAYLGDADVGAGANVGAGTICCNYDGFAKHRTQIGAGAFIGSDTQLIAPVTIGARAYVATGTTLTADVPDDGFALSRVPQVTKPGYATRLRERLRERAEKP